MIALGVELVRWEEIERTFREACENPVESHEHGQLVIAKQGIVHVIREHTIDDLSRAVNSEV
jgi:TPP-dependent indolepyruvate ferredoxin oxidoreductase alpha subunit